MSLLLRYGGLFWLVNGEVIIWLHGLCSYLHIFSHKWRFSVLSEFESCVASATRNANALEMHTHKWPVRSRRVITSLHLCKSVNLLCYHFHKATFSYKLGHSYSSNNVLCFGLTTAKWKTHPELITNQVSFHKANQKTNHIT